MKRTYLPLLAAFTIPIVTLLIIIGLVYLPNLLSSPRHDFVYSYTSFNCNDRGLTPATDSSIKYDSDPTCTAFWYRFDMKTKTSRTLTTNEVQQLKLSTSNTSPDGFTLERASSNPYTSNANSPRYKISNGWAGIMADLNSPGEEYLYNLTFRGWVR